MSGGVRRRRHVLLAGSLRCRGRAVGRAIRTSIVTIVVADFFLSFAIWGSTTTVRITG